MNLFKKSSKVQWKWMGKSIHGTIEEVFESKITKNIKGKKITRNGTPENPAYLVKSEAGNLALKLQTELSVAAAKKSAVSKPKMFGRP